MRRRRMFSFALALVGCGLETGGEIAVGSAPTSPAEAGPPASAEAPSLAPPGSDPADAAADAATDAPACEERALSFDGVDDHVTVPDHSDLDLSGDFTVEAWIKPGPSVATGAEMHLASHHDAFDSRGWSLFIRQRRVEIVVWGDEDFSSAAYSAGNEGPEYVVPNQWVHVAGTKQGDTLRVYHDGLLRDSQDLGFFFFRDDYSGPLHVGRAAYTASYFFEGQMDDLRLSTNARYTGQTAAAPAAPLAADDATVLLLRFDEAAGGVLDDAKGKHAGSMAAGAASPARVSAPCVADR